MFWGDSFNQDKAMQSFRNSMYTVRKFLGKDILENNSGGIVSINEKYEISSDYNSIISGKLSIAEIDDVEFMKSYYLKESSLFNEWLDEKKQEIKIFLIEKSLKEVEKFINEDQLDSSGT